MTTNRTRNPGRVSKGSRRTSRRSQPPLALSVPHSRFTSRVGGGSAFYVRRLWHPVRFQKDCSLLDAVVSHASFHRLPFQAAERRIGGMSKYGRCLFRRQSKLD